MVSNFIGSNDKIERDVNVGGIHIHIVSVFARQRQLSDAMRSIVARRLKEGTHIYNTAALDV